MHCATFLPFFYNSQVIVNIHYRQHNYNKKERGIQQQKTKSYDTYFPSNAPVYTVMLAGTIN